MARILYHCAKDSLYSAEEAFRHAQAARTAGHDVGVVLADEAILVMKSSVAEAVLMPPAGSPLAGAGVANLDVFIKSLAEQGVSIYMFRAPSLRLGITDEDLLGKNARFIVLTDFANLAAEYDRVISV